MSDEKIDRIAARWNNDPAFRERLTADPEATAAAEGLDLTEADLATLKGVNKAGNWDQVFGGGRKLN